MAAKRQRKSIEFIKSLLRNRKETKSTKKICLDLRWASKYSNDILRFFTLFSLGILIKFILMKNACTKFYWLYIFHRTYCVPPYYRFAPPDKPVREHFSLLTWCDVCLLVSVCADNGFVLCTPILPIRAPWQTGSQALLFTNVVRCVILFVHCTFSWQCACNMVMCVFLCMCMWCDLG